MNLQKICYTNKSHPSILVNMSDFSQIEDRKQEHIQINLSKDVQSALRSGFDEIRLVHCALPEMSLEDVDMTCNLFGKQLSAPLLISSMTGGTDAASEINRILAMVAQQFRIAMGVGSQRIMIDQPDKTEDFKVRSFAPDILLFANLGAVQLNYSYTIEHCKAAIDSIEADGLILHLNPLQEALMHNGDTNFRGLIKKIAAVCKQLGVPVIIKEVGWGINATLAKQLFEVGVSAIDVAGAGGTSWSEVEKYRSNLSEAKLIAADFRDWGIPTVQAIKDIKRLCPDATIIASGGLKNGIDVIKSIALGASMGGMAHSFLSAAADSFEKAILFARVVLEQMRIAMFVSGAKDIRSINEGLIVREN